MPGQTSRRSPGQTVGAVVEGELHAGPGRRLGGCDHQSGRGGGGTPGETHHDAAQLREELERWFPVSRLALNGGTHDAHQVGEVSGAPAAIGKRHHQIGGLFAGEHQRGVNATGVPG